MPDKTPKYDADARAKRAGADVVPVPIPIDPKAHFRSYKVKVTWEDRLKPKWLVAPHDK